MKRRLYYYDNMHAWAYARGALGIESPYRSRKSVLEPEIARFLSEEEMAKEGCYLTLEGERILNELPEVKKAALRELGIWPKDEIVET